MEARIALPDWEEEGAGAGYGRFTLQDVTSGLPEDSREADERAVARSLRDLRVGVKAARAVAARTPGLAAIFARGPARAAWFWARFEVTPEHLRHGAPTERVNQERGQLVDATDGGITKGAERVRRSATLPRPRG